MFVQSSFCKHIMKVSFWVFLACMTTPLVCIGNTKSKPDVPITAAQVLNLPMHFVKNAGQTDKRVDFVSRGPGYTLFLTPTQAVFSLSSTRNSDDVQNHHDRQAGRQARTRIVDQLDLQMNLVGANTRSVLEAIDQLPGTINYIIGNQPAHWVSGVPMFEKVKYHEVYPGISLVYYGNQRQLEYDFIAAPEADPRQIALDFPGVKQLEVAENGDLLIHFGNGILRWHKPIAYQIIQGTRQGVEARYILKEDTVIGFEVGAYDRSLPLVIDPVLLFATYLGGSLNDYVCGLSLDSNGNILVAGHTSSINFPAVSAYRSTMVGGLDAIISKLNNTGTALLYSTYLGGAGNDIVESLAVDSAGNAYVAGTTDSVNFPTRNPAFAANAGFNDAFIAKIGPFGTNLLYGSYLGGDGDDSANGIAVDNSGNAFIAGDTFSIGTGNGPFPTFPNNAYQANNAGGRDAFVAKFNTTLSGTPSLIYSTFLGGDSDDKAYALAVDSSANVIVVGEVASYPTFPTPPSSDFPLVNAYQSSFNRGNLDPLAGYNDGFVTKINASGTALIFSTFLGGGDSDFISNVVLDNAGRIYVVGESSSTNFPVTANAVQSIVTGSEAGFPAPDLFATVFQSSGNSLYYSTLLGGSGYESGFGIYHAGIAVDRFGNIYIAGQTESIDDFPLTSGADQIDPLGPSDAFVSKINPAVTGLPGLIYSTFLGGDSDDRATAIVVDTNSVIYVAGISASVTNLATPGVYRGTNSGNTDVFVAKLSSPPDLSVTMIPSSEPVTVGSNLTYTIQVNNNGRSTFSGVTNIVAFSSSVTLLAVSSSAGNWRTNGNQLIFNIGTLTNNANVSQSVTISTPNQVFMTNSATLTAIDQEINTNNNRATLLATVSGIADVRLIASRTPEPVSLTSNVTYTLEVNNKGPYAARLVELAHILPENVSFVSATNTLGGCTNFDGVIVCGFATLTNNATATVTIVAKAITNGSSESFSVVSSIESDSVPANNEATLTTTVSALADLAIGQTGPLSGYAGTNYIYALHITNHGPSTATGVVVTDVIPAGAVYVDANNPLGSESQSNGIVTCTISSLASNATATITVTVRPMVGGTITNSATINSSADEPTPGNNSASLVTTVTASADLGISQIASPGSARVLSNFTFTITVTNRGPSGAVGVTVTNRVPSGLAIISVQPPPGSSYTEAGGVITFNLGTMTNSATGTLIVQAQGIFDGVFTNTASIYSPTADPNSSNTINTVVTVTPNPDAPILKIARAGGKVVLSWPTNAVGFSLQSKTNLAPSTPWTSVTNIQVTVGNLYMVTNNVDGTANYYRLIRDIPPALSAMRVGNRVVVHWPAYNPVGILKSTTNLTPPITWNDVGITPFLSGGRYFVTNSVSDRAFYRLFY
jgi:uncharacterized repeat protein (TIGR01451 family)